MNARKILGSIAAVSASVLAITHLGANPVAPGADLGVVVTVNAATDSIVVRSDAGDLTAFVKLTIKPPTSDTYTAQLEDGTVLGATARPGIGSFVLTIHKPATSPTTKFDWPSGVNVMLRRVQPAVGSAKIEVEDWEVFSAEDQSDAKWKARRRTIWRWVSTISLLFAAIGAVLVRGDEDKKQTHGAKDSVALLIDEIEGDDAQQTKHIRTFLRKRVLEGASYDEALGATGLRPGKARIVSAKALHYFPVRLEQLILDLQRIADEL